MACCYLAGVFGVLPFTQQSVPMQQKSEKMGNVLCTKEKVALINNVLNKILKTRPRSQALLKLARHGKADLSLAPDPDFSARKSAQARKQCL